MYALKVHPKHAYDTPRMQAVHMEMLLIIFYFEFPAPHHPQMYKAYGLRKPSTFTDSCLFSTVVGQCHSFLDHGNNVPDAHVGESLEHVNSSPTATGHLSLYVIAAAHTAKYLYFSMLGESVL